MELKRLYEQKFDAIVNYVLQFVKDEDAAKDVAQDTFVSLFSTEVVIEKGKEEALLYHAARMKAFDYLRAVKSKIERHKIENLDWMSESNLEDGQSLIERDEDKELVYHLLNKLPEIDRYILMSKFLDGEKYVDISSKLDKSKSFARRRAWRALVKLNALSEGLGDV